MCIHGDKSQPERDWVLAGTMAALQKTLAFTSTETYFSVCVSYRVS